MQKEVARFIHFGDNTENAINLCRRKKECEFAPVRRAEGAGPLPAAFGAPAACPMGTCMGERLLGCKLTCTPTMAAGVL